MMFGTITKVVWHPESPGETIVVVRSWWQRLLYPRDFATLGEAIKDHEIKEAIRKRTEYCDHDYSGGNYSTCPKCGEFIR